MATPTHDSRAVELWYALNEAMHAGDRARVDAVVAPNFEWHSTGRGPLARTYHGVDEFEGLFRKVQEATDTFRLETEMTVGDDDRATVVGRVTATRPGKTLDVRNIFLIECKDGRIARGWMVSMDQYAFDDFFR